MKIAIFSRKFAGVVGGVEKMVLSLASEMSSRGHTVFVFSLDEEGGTPFYPWPKDVGWIKIGFTNPDRPASWLTRFRRCKLIRKHIKTLGIESLVGFQVGSFALAKIATLGLKIHSVAAERNAPTLFDYIRLGKSKKFIANLFLLLANVITVQLNSQKNLYPSLIQKKIVITPNYIAESQRQKSKLKNGETPTILFVGRLTFQKNVETLINAVPLLKHKINLVIVGEGEMEYTLKNLVKKLGLNVAFEPFKKDLTSNYLNADILCLPSRWEGFPNVVGEALSFGLPVVGFRACSGLEDLITDRLNGMLAAGNHDAQSLALALDNCLDFPWDPDLIQDSTRPYSVSNFANKWESALTPFRR